MKRRINIKAHAIAIGAITLSLLIMYSVLKPPPPASITQQIGDHYIRIDQAHWGLNCNATYEEYLRKKRLNPNNEDKSPPSAVPANNILSIVSNQCNLKQSCDITADVEVLGNPYEDCLKEIKITWRCFSYDTLHSAEGAEGDIISISCAPKKPDTESGAE